MSIRQRDTRARKLKLEKSVAEGNSKRAEVTKLHCVPIFNALTYF